MPEANGRPGFDTDDAELSRELAASLAGDIGELLELSQHLDHRLRRGAGLPDRASPAAAGTDQAGPDQATDAPTDVDGLLDATQQALAEAERASLTLRASLTRALGLVERVRAL